jgi:RNAse (barnase) inhibitor barstar
MAYISGYVGAAFADGTEPIILPSAVKRVNVLLMSLDARQATQQAAPYALALAGTASRVATGRGAPKSGHVYRIELNRITSRKVLHADLARVFSFPDYYGRNWDAFDECIDDIEQPASVEVLGFDDFRFRLPREAKLLICDIGVS